jgi:hypothetical protein
MRIFDRIGAALVASVLLSACDGTTVEPTALRPAAPLMAASAAEGASGLAYRRVDTRFPVIHFGSLPCDENGNWGEFVRVEGELHVWGRVPDLPIDEELEGEMPSRLHYQLHFTFAGVGTTESGRVFDVTERELDVFNGDVFYGPGEGSATWRLHVRLIERGTGTRYDMTFSAKMVITPSGNLAVDRFEGYQGCDA